MKTRAQKLPKIIIKGGISSSRLRWRYRVKNGRGIELELEHFNQLAKKQREGWRQNIARDTQPNRTKKSKKKNKNRSKKNWQFYVGSIRVVSCTKGKNIKALIERGIEAAKESGELDVATQLEHAISGQYFKSATAQRAKDLALHVLDERLASDAVDTGFKRVSAKWVDRPAYTNEEKMLVDNSKAFLDTLSETAAVSFKPPPYSQSFRLRVAVTDKFLAQPLRGVVQACKSGDSDTLMFLVRNGASVNAATEHGYTPLHIASQSGQKDVAQLLVKLCADINATDTYGGYTALHWASEAGHKHVVESLLEIKAALFKRSKWLLSALELAVKHNHADVARLLYRRMRRSERWRGVDIDLPKGMTLEDDEPSGDDGPPEWKGWRDEQQRRLQKKGRGLGRYEEERLEMLSLAEAEEEARRLEKLRLIQAERRRLEEIKEAEERRFIAERNKREQRLQERAADLARKRMKTTVVDADYGEFLQRIKAPSGAPAQQEEKDAPPSLSELISNAANKGKGEGGVTRVRGPRTAAYIRKYKEERKVIRESLKRQKAEAQATAAKAIQTSWRRRKLRKPAGPPPNAKRRESAASAIQRSWRRKARPPPAAPAAATTTTTAPPREQSKERETEALPTGWERVLDEASGELYYYNTVTGESSWDRPTTAADDGGGGGDGDVGDVGAADDGGAVAASDADNDIDERLREQGWMRMWDDEQQHHYYCNETTGESTWELPV